MPRLRRRSRCPVACTLDLVGDRWTLLVIRDLFLAANILTNSSDPPKASRRNVLSARLARLIKEELASKQPDPNDKRRSTYHLTEKGRSLHEVLVPLVNWGLRNLPKTEMMAGSERALQSPK